MRTTFNSKIIIRQLATLLVFSGLLFSSELTYRWVYNIPPLSRYIETFLIIFGVLTLYYFARYKVTRLLMVLFFLLCVVANNIHFQIYQSWINGINYFLMLKEITEVSHAGFAIYQQWFGNFLWGMAEVFIFMSIGYFRPQKTPPITDGLFAALMLYIFIRSFSTSQELGISPAPHYSRIKANFFSFGYFVGRILPYNVLNLSDIPPYSSPAPTVAREPEINNIVLIMGESEAAAHVSYFGYHRPTTPFLNELAQQQPSAVIKKVYSAGFMTAVSLPMFFNAIPYPNGINQIIKGDTNLFRLAKQQGYQTYFFSSQPENQMMIMNLIGKSWVDTLRFPTHQGYRPSELMPDKKLLPHLYNINLNQGKHFIVLHQRGSHSVFGESLTNEEKMFKGGNPRDEYDNTIYNTDKIIQQVYEYLQKRDQKDWILLYTSDHGQYVTDTEQNQGTHKPQNYIVPLLIFTPNAQLQQQVNAVFNPCKMAFHQQVSTLLIRIMGYDMSIADCQEGVVTGNFLSGDVGYLKIRTNGKSEFIYPQKGGLTHKFRKAEIE